MNLELRLLLACARIPPVPEAEATIREVLDRGIDWTLFAQMAIDHGLAGLAGQTLDRVAPDAVPGDILDALRVNLGQTRKKNRKLFDELTIILQAMAGKGVEAIPFKGPVTTLQAYGDLGLRVFRDLDFLIRDPDLAATLEVLRGRGYEREPGLNETQLDAIHRIQGQEIVRNNGNGLVVEPHTRLTPRKMALGIGYAGLWQRARRTTLLDRTMLTLAPEDHILILAIHGGKEMWWRISWVCDVAALIGAHPKLDWTAILARARTQGCLRMVLLAVSLARRYFHVQVPAAVSAAEIADKAIEPMAARIMAHWLDGEPAGPPSNKSISMDRMLLHDGLARRANYAMRTWFLPDPHHAAWVALPKGFGFAYVPLKLVHDVLMLPLFRTYRNVFGHAQDTPASLDLAFAAPGSGEVPPGLERYEQTRADACRTLAADPGNAAAWCDLGSALSGLKRHKDATACYGKALALAPKDAAAWKGRGVALLAAGKREDALPFIDMALALNPEDADAWAMRAGALAGLERYTEAQEASDRALGLDPEHMGAARTGIRSRLLACDWRRRESDEERVAWAMKTGVPIIGMIDHRTMRDCDAENLLNAHLRASEYKPSEKPLWDGERYRHDKIRIAYLSTDFRTHPVASVIVGCLEHHDKTRFETTGISLRASDGSKIRQRIETAFDRFIDAVPMSDAEVAASLRASEIDIVIDLNGYTGAKRTEILAHRPAPVQVNYLGYPGTMGLPFFDYIVADRIVIPDTHRIHYGEKVIRLPHSYLPYDNTCAIAEKTPSRAELGLPERGFVFACFNNSQKIGPEIFSLWMRLLREVEGSVLWLRATNTAAAGNLRREAEARGVAAERLIFASRRPQVEDYLAQLRVGDIFLDTLPYNAHSTASDALWAGLPVLTCLGNSFPARVAASLLHGIGMPELVTASLAEYEALALALARDPQRLAALKAKLMRNRGTEPLFDTARFTNYLESA